MAIRGNTFPNGETCPSVILGGASYGEGLHLKLAHQAWLSINGAPIDYDLATPPQGTWAARTYIPELGGIPLDAVDGDTVQLFSIGHTGPIKAFIQVTEDGGETFVTQHELTILPGESESSIETISMAPFIGQAYAIYSIPDQPPATV